MIGVWGEHDEERSQICEASSGKMKRRSHRLTRTTPGLRCARRASGANPPTSVYPRYSCSLHPRNPPACADRTARAGPSAPRGSRQPPAECPARRRPPQRSRPPPRGRRGRHLARVRGGSRPRRHPATSSARRTPNTAGPADELTKPQQSHDHNRSALLNTRWLASPGRV